MLKPAALAIIVVSACAAPQDSTPRPAADLVGQVTRVRDGDTIIVGQTPVRLFGLHAPELRDPGGREARAAMLRLVTGRVVYCRSMQRRSYDRVVAICMTETHVDVAAVMIAAGHGRDCPKFSGGRYSNLETKNARARFTLPRYCREG